MQVATTTSLTKTLTTSSDSARALRGNQRELMAKRLTHQRGGHLGNLIGRMSFGNREAATPLIAAAIRDAAERSSAIGFTPHPEFGDGVLTWHLAQSRGGRSRRGIDVRRPRHFLVCRTRGRGSSQSAECCTTLWTFNSMSQAAYGLRRSTPGSPRSRLRTDDRPARVPQRTTALGVVPVGSASCGPQDVKRACGRDVASGGLIRSARRSR